MAFSPPSWPGAAFNGGTITDRLTVTPSAAAGATPDIRINSPVGTTDDFLACYRDGTERVAKISNSGIMDAARCSFGGYGGDHVGSDPLAAEDQDSGNVIFEVKDGGGLNAYEADGTTILFAVSPLGVIDAPHLPTADPLVAGRLWNSAGTLKVSAG